MLMELAFLLRGVGAEVCWVTNQKPSETDDVVYSLEHKMFSRGVQVVSVLFFRFCRSEFCNLLTLLLGKKKPRLHED